MRLPRALLILLLLALAASACERRSGRGTISRPQLPKILAAATVLPLAQVASEVGGTEVRVHWLAERGQQVCDYGDRPGVPAYQPSDRALEPFQEAQFLIADGRCDRWALVGRSVEVLISPSGPVLQLHTLSAAEELAERGAAGATWLDPVTLAESALETAARLTAIRPEQTDQFQRNAERLHERLAGLVVGLEPRFERVAIISSEPTPLLARLGIEPVLVTPRANEVVPDPFRLAAVARQGGAQAVLLPADWAEANRRWWEEQLGLPVVVYDALGSSEPGDERSNLIALMRFNLDQLARFRDPGADQLEPESASPPGAASPQATH